MGSGGGGIRGVAPLFPPTTPLPIHPPHLPISSPRLADPGIREQDSGLWGPGAGIDPQSSSSGGEGQSCSWIPGSRSRIDVKK